MKKLITEYSDNPEYLIGKNVIIYVNNKEYNVTIIALESISNHIRIIIKNDEDELGLITATRDFYIEIIHPEYETDEILDMILEEGYSNVDESIIQQLYNRTSDKVQPNISIEEPINLSPIDKILDIISEVGYENLDEQLKEQLKDLI